MSESTRTLILLRHGQSEWNAENLFTGWVDVPLTEQGRDRRSCGDDLLGLVVDLDTVVLDIVAQPGPGNLLGNLLCAVAGLLDGNGGLGGVIGGLLDQLVGILEDILGQLNL